MKKYKILIYILIALVGFGALTYFVFLPQIRSSFLLFAANSVKKEQISNLEKKKASLDSLKKEKQGIEELSTALSSMLPDKKEAGRFMIGVEALAQENKIDLMNIKFSEEKKAAAPSSSAASEETGKKTTAKTTGTPSTSAPAGTSASKFKEITFEITIEGSYADTMNFLKGLEKINRAITVEKCDLLESEGIIQANIKGKAYYQNG